MPQTGLGVLLRQLREGRGLSLREVGQLCSTDHAYVHRLETGEKEAPSSEVLSKLLRVLKADERQSGMAKWLADHVEADPALVEYTLQDDGVSLEIFTAAAGVRHRGTSRPDPATLIARVKKAFEE
jgi:transcriptional regulator with XRE-family HTH domain